ncbi:hypothetical protein D3C72_1683070 [compost metagenome]
MPSVVPSSARRAITVMADRVAASRSWGARSITALPFSTTAIKPLPASSRSSACCGVNRPATGGAVFPAISAGSYSSSSDIWRATSTKASCSGWRAELTTTAVSAPSTAAGAAARDIKARDSRHSRKRVRPGVGRSKDDRTFMGKVPTGLLRLAVASRHSWITSAEPLQTLKPDAGKFETN